MHDQLTRTCSWLSVHRSYGLELATLSTQFVDDYLVQTQVWHVDELALVV